MITQKKIDLEQNLADKMMIVGFLLSCHTLLVDVVDLFQISSKKLRPGHHG